MFNYITLNCAHFISLSLSIWGTNTQSSPLAPDPHIENRVSLLITAELYRVEFKQIEISSQKFVRVGIWTPVTLLTDKHSNH